MSKEAMSEQSSVCEGAGYDEVFQSSHELEEGFSQSLERDTSAHFPDKEVESCDGEEEEEGEGEDKGDEGGEDGEDDGDESEVDGRTFKEGSLGSPEDGHTCPFILPKM